jgi:hypothetical protein
MTILSATAKHVTEALARAQYVGRVEEPFTVAGCEIVLQSLRPDEYETIQKETGEFEDLAFLNAWRAEHLCRSLVEFNGVDIRGVHAIELPVEEIDPDTKQTLVKKKRIERHAFVRDYILSTWSREAMDVAFRKFNDVVARADKVAQEGVVFVVPDETSEEKYRRLVQEMKEVEGQIPVDLVVKILGDAGYVRKVEYGAAHDQLSKVKEDDEASEPTPDPAPPPSAPEPPPRPTGRAQEAPARTAPPPSPLPSETSQEARPSPEEMMRKRQPLNRDVVSSGVPSAPRIVPTGPAGPPVPSKSQRYAAIEEAASEDLGLPDGSVTRDVQVPAMPATVAARPITGGTKIVPVTPPGQQEVAELSHPQPKLDPRAAEPIFEQPPVAGINPRFRPPPRF